MLVAHWPLTESSGDALDYAGANDGTVNGATQGATGPLGYGCYSFDGVGDFVDVSGTYFATDTNTMCVWFKTGGTDENVLGTYDGSFPQIDIKSNLSGLASIRYKDTSGDSIQATGGVVDDDSWHHVVGIRDGSECRLWLDGRYITADENTSVDTDLSTGVDIGRRPDGQDYLSGMVFDVRIYDHALTPAEVAALADVGSQAAYVSPKQQL